MAGGAVGSLSRILVATDFSPRSDRALLRAVMLAKRLGATLRLVHVIDSDAPPQLRKDEEKSASDQLRNLCEKIETSGQSNE